MPYFICPNCKQRSIDIDGDVRDPHVRAGDGGAAGRFQAFAQWPFVGAASAAASRSSTIASV